jgi:SAM-dependent methyltransferase
MFDNAADRLAARVSLVNRRRKMRRFLEQMRPGPETTIVDVGVADSGFGVGAGSASTYNFFEVMYPWPRQITAVSDTPLDRFQTIFPEITCIVADGKRLPFADRAFDIAFSNAVVEHVGTRAEQRVFVHELCRVAAAVFITTPNRLFPVEVHTRVPFVHWLPRRLRDRVFALLEKADWQGVDLLGPGELLSLFPDYVSAKLVERGITLTATARRT